MARSQRGVIVYSIANQNTYDTESAEPICYHRFIHKRTSQEMIEFINQRSWEWNFPELALEPKKSAKASTVPATDGSKVIGRRDNVIEIDDPRNDSTIRLFLVDTPEESM